MVHKNHFRNKTSDASNSSRDLASAAMAVALGLFVGWLDLHITEVIVTILALMTFGLLLGLIQPKRGWRWALLITFGLPVMELVANEFSWPTAEPIKFDFRVIFVALIFTLIGTYIGVFIRYILRS